MTDRCAHGVLLAVYCPDCEWGLTFDEEVPEPGHARGWIALAVIVILALAPLFWVARR